MSTYSVTSNSFRSSISILEDNTILLNGIKTEVGIEELSPNTFSVVSNGYSFKIIIQETEEGYQVLLDSMLCEFAVKSERELLLESYAIKPDIMNQHLEVRAPMPALVVEVEVALGDSIESGQGLLKLEAMKMENEIKAHQSGKVKHIHVAKGDTVEKGELLIVLE